MRPGTPLPPEAERFSVREERLSFDRTPEGTRRVVRVERVAVVEQVLTVEADLPSGAVILGQRHLGEFGRLPGTERARIGMAADEARHIAARLLAAADAIDAARAVAGERVP